MTSAARGDEKFKAVNTLIGNLETALTGTCHAINFAKYAYRYMAEVQFRFNRRYDLRAILGDLLRCAVSYPEEIEVLRELGADAVFHVYDEAGGAFADDALAGVVPASA
jgi:hypothetical protein